MVGASQQFDAFEAHDSQRVKVTAAKGGNSIGLRAYITGTDDRDAALSELLANLNNVLLIRGTLPVVADQVDLQPHGYESWVAEIEYVSPEETDSARQPKAVGECTFEFDGTGGTTKLLQAYAQRKFPDVDGTPDFGTAIGVTAEGIQGVDVVVPKLSFTVSQKFDGPSITLPWLRNLVQMTGTTNAYRFMGFEAGELLFAGPAGQQPLAFMDDGTVSKGSRDVSFRFVVSPNLYDLMIGGITIDVKRGHEYLWTRSVEKITEGTNYPTQTVVGVYVAKVYQDKDFANLGINDPWRNFPVAGA